MVELNLGGTWELWEAGSSRRVSCQVPGTVLSALVGAGVLGNPYDQMEEYAHREVLGHSFSFERSFEAGPDLLGESQVELICKGLDTLAQVSLNGAEVLRTENMHRTYRACVKELLREGRNEIRVTFTPAVEYIKAYQPSPGREIRQAPVGCMYGGHLLRKAHCSLGWDWGPQLPDMGIFRDILLKGYSGLSLEEVRLTQEHCPSREEGHKEEAQEAKGHQDSDKKTPYRVTLKTWVRLKGEEGEACAVRVRLLNQEGECVQEDFRPIRAGEREAEISLEVENPRLWWPHSFGESYLYKAVITLENAAAKPRETVEKTVGFRTLTVSRERDAYGREFCFVVNGVKIFAMGANWIPQDAVLGWVTHERTKALIDAALDANMNMLRVWGGGYYPGDDFYELCDARGILVWQDLMFACNIYDCTDAFLENCREEIRDNVKRFRHHPCLALICGNNEQETAWVNWESFQGAGDALRKDYLRMFEEVFRRLIEELAPQVFYWSSSPSSGGGFLDPENENDGDSHYWEVWHQKKPFTDYENHYFRFLSEFGFQSFPCLKTVETYAGPSQQNIFSPVMESHQKNPGANGLLMYYLSQTFRYAKGFDDLLYLTQLLQGMAIRFGVNHLRRNRGRCMGSLYWQLDDNWPVASWSSVDYYGRYKALHYMARQFYAPVTASILMEEERAFLYLENETRQQQPYEARLTLRNMYCEILAMGEGERVGEVSPLSSTCLLSLELPKGRGSYPPPHKLREMYVEAKVSFRDGRILRISEPLLAFKQMELKAATLHVRVEQEGEQLALWLTSPVYTPFVELSLEGRDGVFSDNYFDLTDGEGVKILLDPGREGSWTGKASQEKLTPQEAETLLRIRSLADTY